MEQRKRGEGGRGRKHVWADGKWNGMREKRKESLAVQVRAKKREGGKEKENWGINLTTFFV